MDSVKLIYYKSDFDCLLKLQDDRGNHIDARDFEFRFSTDNSSSVYTAGCMSGGFKNCVKEDDGIRFVFNNHRLAPGTLRYEAHYLIPDDKYHDGIRDVYHKGSLNIQLVRENVGCPDRLEVEVLAPYIKGDPGKSLTYADLTEADKKDLASHIDTSGIKGAPGASAYETWLAQGNTGTEADFLQWLRAPAGSCDVNFVPITDEEIDAAVQEVLDADKAETPDNPES